MDLPGDYHWRPLRVDDVSDVAALNARWEEHHQLAFRGDAEEIAHDLNDPNADLAERTISAWDSAGVLRGTGWVLQHQHAEGAPKHRAIVSPIADPEHEALEDVLIQWCDDVAVGLLAGIDDGRERVLRAWSPLQVAARLSRFEQHGYRVVRYFSTLSRPVTGAPPPQPPDGVTLVDWGDAHHHSAWETHTEAFSDHWGSVPPSWDSWRSNYIGDPHSRLDLSAVAMAGDAVVGYSLNQVWPGDVEVRGLTEGYIGALGVRRNWRRRGIATALILESIRRFADAGFDNATLTADADSTTGAFGLYLRLGFEVVATDVTMVKDL